MTATNMCSNFGGFRCSPPLTKSCNFLDSNVKDITFQEVWRHAALSALSE